MQHLISIICSANSITELCPLSHYKCYDNYNINRLTCCLVTSRGQFSSWAAPLGEYKPFQLRRLVRRSPFATVKFQAEEKKHLNSLTPSGSHYTHRLSFHCACATLNTEAQPLEGAYLTPILLWRRLNYNEYFYSQIQQRLDNKLLRREGGIGSRAEIESESPASVSR